MTDFISQDFEQKNVAAETFDRDLYNKLYRLKLPCVFQLKQPIPANIIEALKENNIQTFLVAENKYAFCHANDEKLINRLSNKYKDMTPRGELLSSHSELEMSETDQDYKYLEDIENNANLELQESNEKSGNWLQRAWKRTKYITASASQIVPGFKYVRKKMKKLENTGFYKYDEGVIVPLANNGKWGISVVDDLLDFETQLPLTIDLSNEAMSQDPKVFLIRQLVLKKAGMPYSRQAISLIRNLTHLEKQEVKLNSETITDLSQIDINTPIIIDGLTVNPNERITSLASRINYDLSDRFSIRTWMDPLLGGTASILWIFAKVTRIPQLQLAEAVRSGVEAGFDIKNEISKMDPEIIKELGWITFAALASKYFVADRSSNIGVKLGLGTLIGIGSAALVNIQAERIAKQKIELARSNGKNMSQRDAEELIAKYKEQAEQLVRFFSSMSAFVSATTSVEMQQLRMANSITDEQIDNAHINRSVPLDNHLHSNKGLDPFMGKDFNHDIEDELRTKNIPVKGAIFNEIDEARNKDLNIKGGNLNQENELLNNNGGGKPVLDGDTNTPNGNAGNQVLEDAKNSAGRTMERRYSDTPTLTPVTAEVTLGNLRGGLQFNGGDSPVRQLEEFMRSGTIDRATADRYTNLAIAYYRNMPPELQAEARRRLSTMFMPGEVDAIFNTAPMPLSINGVTAEFGDRIAARANLIGIASAYYHENQIAGDPDLWDSRMNVAPGTPFKLPDFTGDAPLLPTLPDIELPPVDPNIVNTLLGAQPGDGWLINREQRALLLFIAGLGTGWAFLTGYRRGRNQNQQYAQNNALGNGANAPLAYPPINVQRPGNPQNPNYAINNLFGQPFILTPEQFIVLPYQIRVMLLNPNLRWPANVLTWRRNRQLRTDLRNLVNNLRGIFPNNANQNIPILQALFNLNVLLNSRRPNPQAINVAIDDVLRQYFLAYPPAGVNPILPQAQVVQMPVVQQQPIRDNFGNRNNNNYNLIIPGVPDLGRITANLNTPNGQRLNTQRVNQLRDLAYAVLAIPQEFAGNLEEWRILQFQARRLLQVINRRGINRANPQEIEEINQFLANIVLAYNNANIRDPGLRQVAQNQVNDPAVDVGAHPNQRDVAQVDQPDHLPDFNFDNDDQFDDLNFDDDDDLVADQDQIDEFDRRIAELQRDLGFFPARDPGADANQQQRAQVAQRQGQPRVADPIRVQPQQVVQPVPDPAPLPVRPSVVSQDQGLPNVQPQDILNLDPNGIQQFQVIRNQTHIPPQLQPIDANRIPNINRAELNKFIGELIRLQQLLNNTTQTDEQATIQKLPNQYASLINFLINNFWDRTNTRIGRFLREFIIRLSPTNENIVNQRANSNVKDNISLELVVEANQNRQAIIRDLSAINTELQNLRDALNAIDNANSVIDDLRRLLGEVDYIRELSPEIRRESETRLKTLDVRIRELIKEVREFIQNPTQDGIRNIQNRINELYTNYDGLLTEIQKYFDRPVTQDDNLDDFSPTPDDPTPPPPATPPIANPQPINPALLAPQQNVAEIISAINEGTFNTINALLAHQAEEAQRNRDANAQDRQAIIDQHDQITTQLLERMDAMNQANTQANENLITELRNLVTRLNAEIEGLREQMDAVDQERRESTNNERTATSQLIEEIRQSNEKSNAAAQGVLNLSLKLNESERLREQLINERKNAKLIEELRQKEEKEKLKKVLDGIINSDLFKYEKESSGEGITKKDISSLRVVYTARLNLYFTKIYLSADLETKKNLYLLISKIFVSILSNSNINSQLKDDITKLKPSSLSSYADINPFIKNTDLFKNLQKLASDLDLDSKTDNVNLVSGLIEAICMLIYFNKDFSPINIKTDLIYRILLQDDVIK